HFPAGAGLFPDRLIFVPMRIRLYCPHTHPRVQYVCEVLFGTLAGRDWEMLSPAEANGDTRYALSYGCTLPGIPEIPASGVLFDSSLSKDFPPVLQHPEWKGLFPASGDYLFPFDL